ncbi:MAG: MFS transporter [Rhodobacteraceae bacterium TMED111]|nr:MFS transporter [Marinovum sp.]OUV42453.1 MAG: MFS transporter [Rhodobacteraceae bacterium TMED111]
MLFFMQGSWALLLGMLFLQLGNGLQGTLLGVRGELEDFSTFEMSVVMSAYFVGFLGASKLVPDLIRRVGHVRVFAALASFISAILILYPLLVNPWVWTGGRVIIGFCFCGVYITAESWLNNAATNENRGQLLSSYMVVQMAGIVAAQLLLLIGDPSGFELFVLISVLVSISFAPILLSITPTPAFETTKPMSIKELFSTSPLGCVGMFFLGGIFSAQFGMAPVFGTSANLSLPQISIFVAAFYIGAMVFQFPVGWLSDRMDRRILIIATSAIGFIAAVSAIFGENIFIILLGSAFFIGGMSNPLYSLLIAYTNDFLEPDDMASASGGLLFLNGLGAISGPLFTGYLMTEIGPRGFFVILAALLGLLTGYGFYRMTQRGISDVDTSSYATVSPTTSVVAVEIAQELAIEAAEELDESV